MYRILISKPTDHFIEKPDAKRVEIFPWVHTFVHKEGMALKDRLWVISEAQTGASISFGPTKKVAIERATIVLERAGEEKTKEKISQILAKNGTEALIN